MRAKARLRPMMHWHECFTIPTVLLVPALCVSVVVTVLSWRMTPLSLTHVYSSGGTVLLVAGMIVWRIVIPAWRAYTLAQHAQTTRAMVIARTQQHRMVGIVSDVAHRIGISYTRVTFVFTPSGQTHPLHLSAEVERATATMQVGRLMPITYAATNPYIVRLPGEGNVH